MYKWNLHDNCQFLPHIRWHLKMEMVANWKSLKHKIETKSLTHSLPASFWPSAEYFLHIFAYIWWHVKKIKVYLICFNILTWNFQDRLSDTCRYRFWYIFFKNCGRANTVNTYMHSGRCLVKNEKLCADFQLSYCQCTTSAIRLHLEATKL